jgi:hypothetical protein
VFYVFVRITLSLPLPMTLLMMVIISVMMQSDTVEFLKRICKFAHGCSET